MPAEEHDLSRFVEAQSGGVFERALRELEGGRKRTHWMWFVFPQIAGLGLSDTAALYAISGLAEARSYLRHEVLGPRLVSCAAATLRFAGTYSAEEIFGYPDYLKFRSSATLFTAASRPGSVFEQILDAFFSGEPDPKTVEILAASA